MLTKDASHAAVQPEAVYVNEAPVVVDGGCSPKTEARAPATAAAAASGGTAATTIITEVNLLTDFPQFWFVFNT